jgi:hypothetical protein
MDRRRNPDKRWSHRDIDTREIGILEVVRTETSQVSKHRSDLDRPLVETRGGDRAPIGTLAHREIDNPVDKRSGKFSLKNLT